MKGVYDYILFWLDDERRSSVCFGLSGVTILEGRHALIPDFYAFIP